jgi:hypothetical protein
MIVEADCGRDAGGIKVRQALVVPGFWLLKAPGRLFVLVLMIKSQEIEFLPEADGGDHGELIRENLSYGGGNQKGIGR